MVKVASWNVNSVKARLPNLLRWLDEATPDVVLLQEIKCLEEAFPQNEIEDKGYNLAIRGQKTYNGVAILSKMPISVEETDLPGNPHDEQARYIEAFTGDTTYASIYLPNGNPTDSPKYPYKLEFMERLYDHIKGLLSNNESFVFGGDYNVIPEDRDCYDPEKWIGDALFLPETHAAWRKILYLGLTDAFRAIDNSNGKYTFWDYQGGAWNKDNGIRIDHLLLSPHAVDRLQSVGIDKNTRGWERPSDHTPIWCELENTETANNFC